MKRSQMIGYFRDHYNTHMHTQKSTQLYKVTAEVDVSFRQFLSRFKVSLWNQTNPIHITTLSFIYQTVWMYSSERMWGIITSFFAWCLCVCSFLWTRILDQHLIILQRFTLTDEEMESQPTLRDCFLRLSKRIFFLKEVNRRRYNDVAKDTDFKEALMIFYTSKHTLINLCFKRQKNASIFSEDYLLYIGDAWKCLVDHRLRSPHKKHTAHRLETALKWQIWLLQNNSDELRLKIYITTHTVW